MKKLILSSALLTALALVSCGKSEVCNCADTGLAMLKEAKEAGTDMQKLQAIQEKYKADMEECEKLDEGKSEEEKKAMEAELKECDAFKEMEKMTNEMVGR
ncbi:MAG: hypothetical protein ACK46O_11085 [Flavobacteriia bacterium]|jgi:hypothetical protein